MKLGSSFIIFGLLSFSWQKLGDSLIIFGLLSFLWQLLYYSLMVDGKNRQHRMSFKILIGQQMNYSILDQYLNIWRGFIFTMFTTVKYLFPRVWLNSSFHKNLRIFWLGNANQHMSIKLAWAFWWWKDVKSVPWGMSFWRDLKIFSFLSF